MSRIPRVVTKPARAPLFSSNALVTTVVAYNPQIVQQKGLPVPTSWQDLTKPQWKGQFSIDPGAVNWYDSLIAAIDLLEPFKELKDTIKNKIEYGADGGIISLNIYPYRERR